jgi:hypothetical protein
VQDTIEVTWSQIAAICPRDGESRCSGSLGTRDLTGWIWATGDQVRALMGHKVFGGDGRDTCVSGEQRMSSCEA